MKNKSGVTEGLNMGHCDQNNASHIPPNKIKIFVSMFKEINRAVFGVCCSLSAAFIIL